MKYELINKEKYYGSSNTAIKLDGRVEEVFEAIGKFRKRCAEEIALIEEDIPETGEALSEEMILRFEFELMVMYKFQDFLFDTASVIGYRIEDLETEHLGVEREPLFSKDPKKVVK